ncbi:uncharacterized protein [Macrobrachium rosenbergii]|uniref:uncharacterized protein n=1 Tax=Macrobrachium rosenbergii TaxID=79674 RepID=UPI0034D6304E
MLKGKTSKKMTGAAAFIFLLTLSVHILYVYNMSSYFENLVYKIRSQVAGNHSDILIVAPLLKRHLPAGLNSVFSRYCYRYEKFTAENNCCGLFDYHSSPSRIEKCVRLGSRMNQNTETANTSSIPPSKTTRQRQHWVFIGDSHCRYIFIALLYIFDKHKLRYRFPWRRAFKTSWQDFHKYRGDLKAFNFHEDLEIVHKEIPLKISFLWDRKLNRLPGLIHKWQTLQEEKPTFVLADTGLYYMVERVQGEFEAFMRKLASNISDFSATVPVVYKLIDHLQTISNQRTNDGVLEVEGRLVLPEDDRRIQRLRVSRSEGHGRDPVGQLPPPVRHLRPGMQEAPQEHEEDAFWLCSNKGHTGYVMVNQYANMVLNHVCNEALGYGGNCV